MIALLDVNGRSVILYKENGVEKIPFDNIDSLPDYIEGKRLFYVTNAVASKAEDIVALVYDLRGERLPTFEESDNTGQLYIHCLDEGTVYVDEEFKFEGRFDLKMYDDEMKAFLETSPVLQIMKKNKKLEIVGESGKERLMKEYKIALNYKLERDKMIDAELDKILVDGKAEDVAAAGGIPVHDDYGSSEIDVRNEEKFLTEAERTMQSIGGIFT
ncbi:MAG: hypothetical protein J7L15_00615 [Clostridiales bacterium]|nr:hypothetical protein [Clostridiales bacterium]